MLECLLIENKRVLYFLNFPNCDDGLAPEVENICLLTIEFFLNLITNSEFS